MTRLLDRQGRPLRLDPDLDAPLVGPSVFAIVPNSESASGVSAWRIWQPFAMLRLHGYECGWDFKQDIVRAHPAALYKMHLVCRAGAMRFERKEMARWFTHMKDAGKVVVYECDDDLFSPFMTDQQTRRVAGEAPPRAQLEAEREACIWVLQRCDGVTVSTQRLATVCSLYTDKPVEVVPNAIDAGFFAAVQRKAERTVPGLTIGWAGGHRPDTDLAEMAEAWGRLARRYPWVTFVVMGSQPGVFFRHVPEHRLRRLPWMDVTEYPKGLVNVDIGCCPLEDRPFNRCKTPIKAWEYAVSGAAVVASPTVYRQVIEDGRTGFLCRTADEWEAALSALVEDGERRRELAGALKRDVLARWSLAKNVWRWPLAWRRLAEG